MEKMTRRRFLGSGAAASVAAGASSFQYHPPPRARPGTDAAERQARHRRHRRRRHGGGEPARARIREHRRPVRRRSGLRGRDDQALPGGQGLHRLPRDARKAEGHRRRGHRHAGPHPRRHHDGRDRGRQARLLPEAADARRLRGPAARPGGQGLQGRDADGHPGPLRRGHPARRRVDPGRPHRRGPRGRCLVQPVLLPLGPRLLELEVGRAARRTRRPSRPGLDWDLWIGPAPFRPYHPAYHPLVWRCWWDFGWA